MSTIRALAYANVEETIRAVSAEIGVSDDVATPEQRRVFAIATKHARAALIEIAKMPLEVHLEWPSGLPADVRRTFEAQLQDELQRAAQRRLKLEFTAMFLLAPALLKSLSEWAAELQSEPESRKAWWNRGRT